MHPSVGDWGERSMLLAGHSWAVIVCKWLRCTPHHLGVLRVCSCCHSWVVIPILCHGGQSSFVGGWSGHSSLLVG